MRLSLLLLAVAAWATPNRVQTHPRAPFTITAIEAGVGDFVYVMGEKGLYRFDGFQYLAVQGYPFQSGDRLAATSDGTLWAGSAAEGLASYRPETGFRVVLRQRIGPLVSAGQYVFAADAAGEWVERLHLSEPPVRLTVPLRAVRLVGTEAGAVWMADGNRAFRLDGATMKLEALAGLGTAVSYVLPNPAGGYWMAEGSSVRRSLDGQVVVRGGVHLRMAGGRNGQVWVATGGTVRGLSPPMAFPLSTPDVRLMVSEGRNGRLWVAGPEGGLWELVPDSGWERWGEEDLDGEVPVQVFRTAGGELVLATESGLLFLDETSRRWRRRAGFRQTYSYVLPLPNGEMLAASNESGLVRLRADGSLSARIAGSEDKRVRDNFRKLVRTADGTILAGNKNALFQLTDGRLTRTEPPGVRNGRPLPHAVDFEIGPAGQLWMGYALGLVAREANGGWRNLATDAPIRDVRSFSFRNEHEVWVAHRFKRVFSRIIDGKVTRFRAEDGYGPDDTYFLKTDQRGWVWRGTGNGVYVSDGQRTDPAEWLLLRTGGESRQYGFFEDRDGAIWIAGLSGVTRVRPDANWFERSRKPPRLSRVVVDGKESATLPEELDPPPMQLEIDLERLGEPDFRAIPVQYRLSPGGKVWRTPVEGRIELLELARGSYRLELRQSAGGAELGIPFRVGSTPLARWWWLGLPVPIVAWLAFRKRELLAYRLRKALFQLRRRSSGRWQEDAVADRSGQTVHGRYALRGLISRGGFAQVYEAVDERDGRAVAVKILDLRAGDAGWVRTRFAQEVAALHMVRHPNVIPLLDSWLLPGGEPCLVMPMIDSGTLRDAMVGEPWAPRRVAALIRALGAGLGAVHAAGIVHRDLKPENVLLLADGSPLLADFGTSGLLGSDESAATTKLLAGSFEYLAPERLTGHYSPACDIYSFGAMVFELLAGKKLVESNVLLASAELERALRAAIAVAAAPDEALRLLEAALRAVPESRPGDAGVWSAQLAEALERGVSAVP